MMGMKKRILALLTAVICMAAPLTLCLEAEAAPVETGTTTLSNGEIFSADWAEMSLTVSYGEKVWEKPFSELMQEEMRMYTEEGAVSCVFANIEWADAFVDGIDQELRAMGNQDNELIPEGSCYQLVDGFELWWLGIVQTQLLTGPVKSINITLNENTCKLMTIEEAELAAEIKESGEYVLAGSCTTSFRGSSANRINNIRVAAGHMDGYEIPSGTEVSLSALFTPRTSANGYKKAGTYVGGKVVEGMGGGICQVSSTTYNALMNAGVTVTRRQPHSSPVHYLPLGTDAAISSGSKDLCFRNDYAHPIMMETIVEGKNLTVNIYVRERDLNGRSYKLWAKKTSSMSAVTYQTVYENGVEVEVRKIGYCRYQPLIEEED